MKKLDSLVIALTFVLLANACTNPRTSSVPDGAKIGFVLIGSNDDFGYNQAVYEGSVAVARAFPDNQVLRTYNIPETHAAVEEAMENQIQNGARLIFATSYGYRDAAVEVARRHPDVIVVHQGGLNVDPPLKNFGTYWGAIYEPIYQAGIAAGAVTKTNKLGFVVSFPISSVFADVNAFTLGARSVNPDVTTQVLFTGSWCDAAEQASAARQLIANGIDVMGQHQDCTKTVIEAAEAAGAYSTGFNYDASELAPHGWLVGAVWNWKDLYVNIARKALSQGFTGSAYNSNFRGSFKTNDNPFVLTELSNSVPMSIRPVIDAARARMVSGKTPFDGPLRDRDGTLRIPDGVSPTENEIDNSMNYFVQGVSAPR